MEIKTISRLNRLKDIVLTLMKYGFADLVDHLDFPHLGPIGKVARVDEGLGTYERIRLVLEEQIFCAAWRSRSSDMFRASRSSPKSAHSDLPLHISLHELVCHRGGNCQ